ncbi:MAG: AmmeMemoRadiSam system protein B [Caldiserica bacterium]|nr:AmmeMemoRadiSam system protein B [Caldisericota bacterium]
MIRKAVVAGQFYPAQARELRRDVEGYIGGARLLADTAGAACRGLIVPHAGYVYSGPVAGSGYACLASLDKSARATVVVLAPSHHVWFKGAALPEADVFRTPLGDINVSDSAKLLTRGPLVFTSGQAHAMEHAVEVQLPFLQVSLGNFSIIPLVLGEVDAASLAQELLALNLPHMLVVASSDLSHYDPYDMAVEHDRATIGHILKGESGKLGGNDACGFMPIRTILAMARACGWRSRLVEYRNSGDTAGDKSAVVGYASIGFWENRNGHE